MRSAVTRACILILTAGSVHAAQPASPKQAEMKITSPAFHQNDSIPTLYTCEGRNLSPPLAWSGVPQNAKSLVLIVDDPDAPDPAAPNRTWVHWVIYDIPPDALGLKEAVKTLPRGAHAGLNYSGELGYSGPCPPIGRHRYFHKLYALDITLADLKRPVKGQVEAAMKDHIIGRSELIGTYQKKK